MHHDLKLLKGRVEFDIFLPSLSLAFEYNGKQHCILLITQYLLVFGYFIPDNLPSRYNTMDGIQTTRDKQKEIIAKEKGITLIIIPYWWNSSEQFVRTIVKEVRPDLIKESLAS
jgi:hypothetical protein